MAARTISALALLAMLVAGCGDGAGGTGADSDEIAALQEQLEAAEQTVAEQAEEIEALNDLLSAQEDATEAPKATEEPTDEPTTPSADEPAEGGDTGSRGSPVPVGEVARVGDWDVRVVSATPNATDQVLAENEFNDPPAEGRQFFVVALEATYVGEESGQFWADVSAKALDDGNVTYSAFEDSCGSIPNSIDNTGEAFTGGMVAGNLCWSVDSARADSLVMFLEPTFSFESERTWFALH